MQPASNIDDRAECAARAEKFLERRPDIAAWFERHKEDTGWDFPRSVFKALFDWGSLTPNQLAAIERGIERDARYDERKGKVAAVPKSTGIDLSNLPAGFYAPPSKVDSTRLKVLVKKGHPNGRWADTIFVSDGAVYGQRKTYGKQMPGREYVGDIQAELREILADPRAAMAAYGHLVGRCGMCNRPLEDEESLARGIGPICAKKLG